MIIIAFAPNSSKFFANIFCKKFKHCAVIVREQKEFVMYQFVSHKKVELLKLKQRDITILGNYGWRFIYLPCDIKPSFNPRLAWACVGMTKRAIGIRSFCIQTPDGLYNLLNY